jgi:type I restriction enzyme M protein
MLSQTCSESGAYEDVPGLCKSTTIEEVASHGFVLTPGRYIGAGVSDDDDEPFEVGMPRLVAELAVQFSASQHLEGEIRTNLRRLGYVC